MANQPLAFGLLLGGSVLLFAGLTGSAIADVVQGKVTHLPSGPDSLGHSAPDVHATLNTNGYTNPLQHAKVTPERIDMGVDYAGTGTYVAAGTAKVTQVNIGGWGKFGNYIEYQLLDGPLAGHFIYYAEGVQPRVKVGDVVPAGAPIADLIPGFHSGTEVGWSSGKPNQSWASVHGGYSEGQLTKAGAAFSDFLVALGAPAGTTGGRTPVGEAFK